MTVFALKPGERISVVAVDPNLKPTHPIVLPPGSEPHPEHPIYIPPPVDPNAPKPEHPIYIAPPPVDPGYGVDVGTGPVKPTHPIVIPPPTEPPTQPPPSDGGNWIWAWAPGLERWVWVRVPGPGEAGPKKK